MGETRVDLQHLLEDLRDAYSGAVEETILTEVIANALDSGASHVRVHTNPAGATLSIVDDGRGMRRRELARYHDVAASTKSRGEGIGFAGVGIKLGLLVSSEVITETQRGGTRVATRWYLASRTRAPWKWIPPPGLTTSRGTAVQLVVGNQLSPLLDAGYVEETIRRHFEPLLDDAFQSVLVRHYPHGVRFEVDGRSIAASPSNTERIPISIRLARRRTASAIGVLERRRDPLPEDRQGIAISTFGKVIRRGWDWLGLTPAAAAHITGLIEAPDLAACLTLSKNDFIRTGTRGASYLAYRKAIQEVVSRQLAAWGEGRSDEAKPRTARLDRDLERVLEDLADDFPLLRSLVDRRTGGEKRLPMPGRGDEQVAGSLFARVGASGEEDEADATPPLKSAEGKSLEPQASTPSPGGASIEMPPVDRPPAPGESPQSERSNQLHDGMAAVATLETVPGRRRPARYGLLVQFESRPGNAELARLVDSTIWINDAHPAFARAAVSRALGYHSAVAVALALAPLAVEAEDAHEFIAQFLAHWGGAHTRARTRRKRRSTRVA